MVELETEFIEGAQNGICASGRDSRAVKIFNADQPLAPMVTGVEIAADRCD
jgi:hypothetical protein